LKTEPKKKMLVRDSKFLEDQSWCRERRYLGWMFRWVNQMGRRCQEFRVSNFKNWVETFGFIHYYL